MRNHMFKLRMVTLIVMVAAMPMRNQAQKIIAQKTFEGSPFFKHVIDIGFQAGPASYWGDLNPQLRFKTIRETAGIFISKHDHRTNIYWNLQASHVRITGADSLSKLSFQKKRNLSFSNQLTELVATAEIPLFRLYKNKKPFQYYIKPGVGVVFFEPFTRLEGRKVMLRPLGTEGQLRNDADPPRPYPGIAMAFPVGLGVRTDISKTMKWFVEAGFRFTSTGFLDDVSGNYAGADAFPFPDPSKPSDAFRLQNRSVDPMVGGKGTVRGNGKTDRYFMVQAGLVFQIWKPVSKYRLEYQKINLKRAAAGDDAERK